MKKKEPKPRGLSELLANPPIPRPKPPDYGPNADMEDYRAYKEQRDLQSLFKPDLTNQSRDLDKGINYPSRYVTLGDEKYFKSQTSDQPGNFRFIPGIKGFEKPGIVPEINTALEKQQALRNWEALRPSWWEILSRILSGQGPDPDWPSAIPPK